MKEYLTSQMFRNPNFPVMVTCLRQRAMMIPHRHDFIELVLVAAGHTIHTIETVSGQTATYGLIPGDCFVILPGDIHSYSESRNLVLYNVSFQISALSRELDELRQLPIWQRLFEANSLSPLRKRIHLLSSGRHYVEERIQKIMTDFSRCRPGWQLRVRLSLLETLCAIDEAQGLELSNDIARHDSGILHTLEYMEKNVQKPFHLQTLAAMAQMSISSYAQKFQMMTGNSPGEYFQGIKLDKICNELLTSSETVAEIAFRYGFCDSTYLIRLFKRRHGITPAQYRKQGLNENIPGRYSPKIPAT